MSHVEIDVRRGLVARDAHTVCVEVAEVDARIERGGDDAVGSAGHRGGDGVEARAGLDLDPTGHESGGQQVGSAVHRTAA